ncbi:MAG TPA: ABC transporter permease [Acidimicrobiales bacterium]|nr:ABC transporter permease [Acidimicrobiales bacterium]
MIHRLAAARDGLLRRWEQSESLRARPVAQVAGWVLQGVLFVLFLRVMFDPPSGTYFNGACIGAVYGIVGVGIILVYRTHRILNFAAAGLGAVAGVGFALLVAIRDFPWILAFPLTIVCGALLGAVVDIVVVRRFTKAPRLILTVATIGLGQILAFVGFKLGPAIGTTGIGVAQMRSPFSDDYFQIGINRFSYDYPFTLVVIAVAVGALAAFLRYTRIGIAMRASAENADRAALLGIPVKRVQTASWVLAGTLASVTIFLRSALVGVPTDGTLGPKVLLFALSAAVIARMESIPRCLIAGVGIGILADSILGQTGEDKSATVYLLVALLAVLLLQRGRFSRAEDLQASSWQAVPEFRPIPTELRRVREVAVARVVVAAVVLAVAIGAPFVVETSKIGVLNLTVISAIVAVSLVVLTGWAGQISLGQFGIVGVGAVVGGKLAAAHNMDFFLVLFLGIVAGAAAAILIGLPALRIRGLYLAVTTLAFAGAMESFFLDRSFRVAELILPAPSEAIEMPVLWDRIDLSDSLGLPNRSYYFVCLVFLALSLLVARAYRRNRAGRAIIAVRENTRAAASYSINAAWTKLGAFAVSGGLAAMAGVLFVYQSRAVDASTYGVDRSIGIFVITVIGGLTSLPGAVLGAAVLETVRYFGGRDWSLLVTGPGLLMVLLVLPGGFAEAFYRARDAFLKRVALRRDIHVPSLVADRRVEEQKEQDSVITEAEHHVEEVETFDVLGEAAVVCPVCGEELPLDDAPAHEHLRPRAQVGP